MEKCLLDVRSYCKFMSAESQQQGTHVKQKWRPNHKAVIQTGMLGGETAATIIYYSDYVVADSFLTVWCRIKWQFCGTSVSWIFFMKPWSSWSILMAPYIFNSSGVCASLHARDCALFSHILWFEGSGGCSVFHWNPTIFKPSESLQTEELIKVLICSALVALG